MPIDWAATGSMLSGWATLAGAGAVIYAARIGANTFDSWKRQKQEERRMDAAEQILTLAYDLRYTLDGVRSLLIYHDELDAAEKLLSEDVQWAAKTDAERDRLKTAQSILTRLSKRRDDWQKVWSLKPLALAFFGKEIEETLHVFWTQFITVSTAAEAYAQDNGADQDFTTKIRHEMWKFPDDDPVGAAIDEAIATLETDLLPILGSIRA